MDLTGGAVKWQVPLGPAPQGSVSLGGAMITGGMGFIARTKKQRLPAYDEATRRELWSAAPPAGGPARAPCPPPPPPPRGPLPPRGGGGRTEHGTWAARRR